MPKQVSAGFVINTPEGWLVCHSTGNKFWDLPKGRVEEGETHLQAAIRETMEETGLDVSPYTFAAIDLGQAFYNRDKDLHLYYLNMIVPVQVHKLKCTSFVDTGKYKYPEVDKFDLVLPDIALTMLSKVMTKWLINNCPQFFTMEFR
jgi:8-oxo-dGTP pyrophosphatase MutT (NUDIX family)